MTAVDLDQRFPSQRAATILVDKLPGAQNLLAVQLSISEISLHYAGVACGLFTHTSDMVHWAQRADGK